MNQKPYLISLTSYGQGSDRYLASLPNLKDSVELIYVEFMPYTPTLIFAASTGVSNVHRVYQGISYPGASYRWRHIPEDLDLARWWIFTDTWDVVFQAPIPDLDQFGAADVLVQYEGETHAENGVWRPLIALSPEMSNLLPLPVFCAGTIAAKGHLMKDLIDYLRKANPNIWDQLHFNQWLIGKNFKDCRELSVALYKNYYLWNISKSQGGKFIWDQSRIVPAIVHGNGSGKEFLPQVR